MDMFICTYHHVVYMWAVPCTLLLARTKVVMHCCDATSQQEGPGGRTHANPAFNGLMLAIK